MSPSDAPRAPKLNLRLGFVIGYVIWLIPCLTRSLLGAVPWKRAMYDSVWIAVLYLLALSVISVAYERMSARGLSLRVAAFVSLVAAVPAVTLSNLLDYLVTSYDPSLTMLMPGEPHSIGYALATSLCDAVAVSTLLAAIVFLPAVAQAHEERNRAYEQLTQEAELLRIRAHLEPHFVLNSLNAVAGLVEEDPAQARELLAALGDLFREASAFNAVHSVSDEIEWLKRYVTIHELRHPDLLRAQWDVHADTLDYACPALILQPLVENAVKHGALRGGGNLAIRTNVERGQLLLTVEDDGPELGGPREGGRGLSIIRRRLELESALPDSLELVREAGRTIARVRLPARLEAHVSA